MDENTEPTVERVREECGEDAARNFKVMTEELHAPPGEAYKSVRQYFGKKNQQRALDDDHEVDIDELEEEDDYELYPEQDESGSDDELDNEPTKKTIPDLPQDFKLNEAFKDLEEKHPDVAKGLYELMGMNTGIEDSYFTLMAKGVDPLEALEQIQNELEAELDDVTDEEYEETLEEVGKKYEAFEEKEGPTNPKEQVRDAEGIEKYFGIEAKENFQALVAQGWHQEVAAEIVRTRYSPGQAPPDRPKPDLRKIYPSMG